MSDDVDLQDFGKLDKAIEAMSLGLSPAQTRKLLRAVGRFVRREQMQRIAAQQDPDGVPYTPRKRTRSVRTLHAMKFLYPAHGGGLPRLVYMRSWTYQGKGQITGFDIKSGGQRTFDRDKIIRFIPLLPGEDVGGAGQLVRSGKKQRAMFRKLRRPQYLRDWIQGEELNIGFRNRAAQAARWHQEGQGNRPIRRLLGWSKMSEDELLGRLLDQIDPMV